MNVNVNLNMNGLLFCKPFVGPLLKSTQDKMERQQECQNTVNFFENQIAMLKNVSGDSLEDISRKLELFHNYKDSIDAAKKKYNNEQMFHTLDEAKEKGEKMAEAAEKMKPKTAEERKEDKVEEVRDDMKQDSDSELMDSIEEITDDVEKIVEKVAEEIAEKEEKIEEEQVEQQIEQQIQEQLSEKLPTSASDTDTLSKNLSEQIFTGEGLTAQEKELALLEYYKKQEYKSVNYYV